MGVGYHETRASNWGLETEIYQLEPHTYGVCIFVSVRVSACILMLTQTHMESEKRALHRRKNRPTVCADCIYACLYII